MTAGQLAGDVLVALVVVWLALAALAAFLWVLYGVLAGWLALRRWWAMRRFDARAHAAIEQWSSVPPN